MASARALNKLASCPTRLLGWCSVSAYSSLPLSRGMSTNSEGTDPPRVLITGGLGQLGGGLAKELRYVVCLLARLVS